MDIWYLGLGLGGFVLLALLTRGLGRLKSEERS